MQNFALSFHLLFLTINFAKHEQKHEPSFFYNKYMTLHFSLLFLAWSQHTDRIIQYACRIVRLSICFFLDLFAHSLSKIKSQDVRTCNQEIKATFNIVLHTSTVIRILWILFLEGSDTKLQLKLIRAVETDNMKLHPICCTVTDFVFQLFPQLFIKVFFKALRRGLPVAKEDTLFF